MCIRRSGSCVALAMWALLLSRPIVAFAEQYSIAFVVEPAISEAISVTPTALRVFEESLAATRVARLVDARTVIDRLATEGIACPSPVSLRCASDIGRDLDTSSVLIAATVEGTRSLGVLLRLVDTATSELIWSSQIRAESIEELEENVELAAYRIVVFLLNAEADSTATPNRHLLIDTEPRGATVYIDGVESGISPLLLAERPTSKVRVAARTRDSYGETVVPMNDHRDVVSIRLMQGYGDVFLRSSDPALIVSVDGSERGRIGSGMIRHVRAGLREFKVSGRQSVWTGYIDVAMGETVTVEVTPRPFGTITYQLPAGAYAVITGPGIKRTVAGTGSIQPSWAGEYEVAFGGDHYVPMTTSFTIERGSTHRLTPDLRFTTTHQIEMWEKRLANMEATLSDGDPVSHTDLEGLRLLLNSIHQSDNAPSPLVLRSELLVARYQNALHRQAIERRLVSIAQRQQHLRDILEPVYIRRARRDVDGWISLGVGIGTGLLAGLFWHLGETTYDQYLASTVTDEAETLRRRFRVWDGLAYGSSATAAVGLGFAAYLWFVDPPQRPEEIELDALEAQRQALEKHIE